MTRWLANHYIFIIPMRGGLCNTTFIGIPCSSDWWMSELLIVIEIGIGLILAMVAMLFKSQYNVFMNRQMRKKINVAL